MRILLFIILVVCPAICENDDFVRSVDDSVICSTLHLARDCLGNVKVLFADNYDEMRRLSGGVVPEWGAGVALPKYGVVIILRKGDLSRQQDVLMHELTHIALHRKIGGDANDIPVPRWFDEGVAQKLSGGLEVNRQAQIAWAVLWRNIISLQSLEQVNEFNSARAHLAYAEAHDAVLFIENFCSIGRLCDSIAFYKDFESGFRAATGISIYEFYERWHKHLVRSYLPFVILGDQRFLWAFAAIAFIAFGFIRLIQLRRRMAKLRKIAQQEQWGEPKDYFEANEWTIS